MLPLKPWKSFEGQLDTLKARGILVSDDAAALRYLERIGYYRLSGYWWPLREIDPVASIEANKAIRFDTFVEGSSFEEVVKLYVFDKKLRLLALDALERIELAVRVDVAHLLGSRDPRAHEQSKYFHGNFGKKKIKKGHNIGKTEHEVWLERFNALKRRAKNDSLMKHHRLHYGERLPIWVAIEIFDFGALSILFAGMNHNDKDKIAKKYGIFNGEEMASWLRSLNFIRNVSAHHSRLWNIDVREKVKTPRDWPDVSIDKPFLYFSLIQHLMNTICPTSTWGERFKSLMQNEFPNLPAKAAARSDMGAFNGWEEWELWRQK